MSTRHLANNFIFVNNRKGKVCSYHISTFAVYFIGSMGKVIDLTGKKFGKLTVVRRVENNKHGNSMWECVCECGEKRVVQGCGLTNGHSSSCGCTRKEKLIQRNIEFDGNTTHGMCKTRIYRIWQGIKRRCCNSNDYSHYKEYGGRGITVCEEWQRFESFYEWAMQNGYADDLTIDRIDVNGNYEPSNCRWTTPKEQANNTRTNRVFTYNGKTQTLTMWAEEYGINRATLYDRLIRKHQWDMEKALTTPVRERK